MERTIRPASLETIHELLRLMQEYCAYEHLDFEEEAARSALREMLSDKALGRIWLIYHDAVPVGYVSLTFGYSLGFGGRDAFIDELYIQESLRGQGLGARAMARVEEAARLIGIRALHLEVESENRRAQRFYQAQGFEERENFRLMSKRLEHEQEHLQT